MPEYQTVKEGKPKAKRRNIRFDQETYDEIREFAREWDWTFSRVVGEAVEMFMQIQPQYHDALLKTEVLAGQPMVIIALRDHLDGINIELDEMLDEAGIEYTKE